RGAPVALHAAVTPRPCRQESTMNLHRPALAAALFAQVAALACGAAGPPAAARHPFPQHVTYTAGVIKPTNATQDEMDAAVTAAYATWKATYVKSLGGQGDWVDCGKACG